MFWFCNVKLFSVYFSFIATGDYENITDYTIKGILMFYLG